MFFDFFGTKIDTSKIQAIRRPVVSIHSNPDHYEKDGVKVEILFEGEQCYKSFYIDLIEYKEYIAYPGLDEKQKFIGYQYFIIGLDRLPLNEKYLVPIDRCICSERILPVYDDLLNNS
jgi:hypothetical protein